MLGGLSGVADGIAQGGVVGVLCVVAVVLIMYMRHRPTEAQVAARLANEIADRSTRDRDTVVKAVREEAEKDRQAHREQMARVEGELEDVRTQLLKLTQAVITVIPILRDHGFEAESVQLQQAVRWRRDVS